MRLLAFIFSKKFRQEFSQRFVSNYEKVNKNIEEIYVEALSENKISREEVA